MTKPAIVQSKVVNGAGASSVQITFDAQPAADCAVVVFVASWFGNVTSVTDNVGGNTYTSAGSANYVVDTSPHTSIWLEPWVTSASPFTVTVIFSETADYTVVIAEFSGVANTGATEAGNTGTGNGTVVSVTTSGGGLSDADGMLIGATSYAATATIAETHTLIREQESNSSTQSLASQYRLPNAAGASSLAWTISTTSNWSAVIVGLKPAVGAPAGQPTVMRWQQIPYAGAGIQRMGI